MNFWISPYITILWWWQLWNLLVVHGIFKMLSMKVALLLIYLDEKITFNQGHRQTYRLKYSCRFSQELVIIVYRKNIECIFSVLWYSDILDMIWRELLMWFVWLLSLKHNGPQSNIKCRLTMRKNSQEMKYLQILINITKLSILVKVQ